MATLWAQVQNHLSFLGVCAVIIAGLYLAARLAQHYLPETRHVSPAHRISILSMCAAVAAVLHILDFPLPFLAPSFYKLDFSELPALLCGFYLGPTAAVVCEAVKILLKLLLKGTTTAFVGDFANFVVGCSMILPASIIYHLHKSKKSAALGLVCGTALLTVFGSAFNAVYLLPKFAQLYGLPLEQIIAMGSAVNAGIHSVSTFVLLAVAPLNLIKGACVSLLTMLLYKRVCRSLFER